MKTLIAFTLRRWRAVVCFWALLVACAIPFCLRLPEVVQGATETIAGSESDATNRAMQRAFGAGAPFAVPVVMQAALGVGHGELQAAAEALARALAALGEVRSVRHFWNSQDALLLGRDGHSALVLVETTAASIGEAENMTPLLRRAVARAGLSPEFRASVTGTAAMFHDLNRNSSDDLKRAELVGIPLMAAILLLVFRSPLAAALPLLLAGAAAALASAGLYLLHPVFPPSAFAQNAVTMIGLGAGVDYALFMVHRFRGRIACGVPVAQAVIESSAAVGPVLVVSGAAVGIGFLALFLVNASFLRSIAVGGLLVIGCAVAMSLTLLPLALAVLGPRINWPFAPAAAASPAPASAWVLWTRRVMSRPWACLLCALAVLAALALPALRASAWNIGASHLPAHLEARQGYEILAANFAPGWMGPVAILLEGAGPAQAIGARIGRDSRVAAVQLAAGRDDTALLVVLPKEAPEAPATMALVRELRDDPWPEAAATTIVRVGGASAAMLDFDAEMFGSLWRVIPAVLGVTAIALIACFRSLLVPLKAICANLAAVLAAYGFLVLVFQELNSFIVLMLFTILFGLSMDYEVLLMRAIQEERLRMRDNAAAVAAGLARSAGVITSAAAIMVCLFASFALTELAATRQFGLGLAVAVALDATLIRLVVIPASMKLLGEANWWFPFAMKAGTS